ncbi:MAG TPA: hypothetical protein VEI83_03655 [Acidimicrobiales bacterium]|nr:hypothetical protein [Acidimicrobiales bacterium]
MADRTNGIPVFDADNQPIEDSVSALVVHGALARIIGVDRLMGVDDPAAA